MTMEDGQRKVALSSPPASAHFSHCVLFCMREHDPNALPAAATSHSDVKYTHTHFQTDVLCGVKKFQPRESKISAEETQIVRGRDFENVKMSLFLCFRKSSRNTCYHSHWKNYGRRRKRRPWKKHGFVRYHFARSKRDTHSPVSRVNVQTEQKVHDILRDGLISFCAGCWKTSSDALAAEHNRFRTGVSPHQRGREQ